MIEFLLDSGATFHIVNDPKLIDQYRPLREPLLVETANGEEKAEAKGRLTLIVTDGRGNRDRLELENVLYVPEINENLMSVAGLQREGYSVQFLPNGNVQIKKRGHLIKRLSRTRDLFIVRGVLFD
jgi:hypothetical protein